MPDFSKIGVSMLKIDDIADYLKLACGFIGRADKATDTEKVGGIDATHIAVADTSKRNSDGSILVDRETVKNAMHLNGHGIDHFVMKDYGDQLSSDAGAIRKNYNQEIADLRDELYQLRAELSRRGMTQRHTPYAGFYDAFRTGDAMHLNGIVSRSVGDSQGADAQRTVHVSDSFYDTVEVGDHLYLYDKNSNKDAVVEIDEKLPDHETLHFTRGTGFDLKKNMVDIYRSRGTVMDGSFTFGETQAYRVDDSVAMYTGLNDDTYSESLPLDRDNPGYAYTFRIPKNMQKSYLSKISIMAQAFGSPGDLVAYVIDEQNIPQWNKIKKADTTGEVLPQKDSFGKKLPTKLEDLIIAKSQPLTIDPSKGMHLAEFLFYGTGNVGSTYGFSNPNPYPYLPLQDDEQERRVRYCLIIEPLGSLEKYDPQAIKNCFLIEFLKQHGAGNDLELNNTTYSYDRSKPEPLSTNASVNAFDLYYGVTLMRAIEKSYVPLGEGIYTARFTQPKPMKASRARLMLRIKREGLFHIARSAQSTAAGNLPDHSTITVESEDISYAPDFSGAQGKKIIVGNTICTLENANLGSLTLEKGLYVDAEAPVYPVGYNVTIKAYYDEWDPERCVTATKYSDRFTLPLVALIPDQFKTDKTRSDRLIFEGDLKNAQTNKFRPYNRYELEVHWKKSREKNDAVKSVNGTNEYPLTAAIHDLSLSLDRAI